MILIDMKILIYISFIYITESISLFPKTWKQKLGLLLQLAKVSQLVHTIMH